MGDGKGKSGWLGILLSGLRGWEGVGRGEEIRSWIEFIVFLFLQKNAHSPLVLATPPVKLQTFSIKLDTLQLVSFFALRSRSGDWGV